MKILFFIESLEAGGKERRLVELIKGLSRKGTIDMELVITKESIHYEDIFSTGIKIHYTLRKHGKKDPSIFYKFYKIAKQMQPDLIHVWGNMTAIYAIPTKVLLRIPLINNQITDAPAKLPSAILSHKLSFPYSDKIIANSYAGLKAYNAPQKKSDVIYNGFDFNRITELESEDVIRTKFNLKTTYVVAMVASFSSFKDYSTYLKAANIVLQHKTDVSFLCIGAGDDSQAKLEVEEQHKSKILFLGRQNDVESIMNVCDIGVLATFTEGISNALLEFMSLEKPVVITGGGGCVELVENNENGFVLTQGNFKMLAEKILLVLDNEQTRSNFGRKSRSIVEHKFGIDKMIDQYSELYTKMSRNNKLK